MEVTNKQILIVEDDNGSRYVLEKFLGKFFDVSSKPDGREALTWMRKNTPDIIVTDLDMPVINGVQFLKNIRSSLLFKDIPIIVISGHDNIRLKKICRRYGILFYYVKPYNPVDLVLKIYDSFNISVEGNKMLERLTQTNG